MHRLRIFGVLVALAIFVFSVPATSEQGPNWKIFERNSILLGQMTGCLLRFQEYARHGVEGWTEDQIGQFLRSQLGDIDEILNRLFAIGRVTGEIPDSQLFRGLIEEIAKVEIEDGIAWLQTLGCYGGLRDHGLVN